MSKKQPHNPQARHHTIKTWHFLVLFLIFSALAAFALRANNLHMAELRQAVYAADKKGKGVETALQDLRAYVGSHMNTNLSSGTDSVYPPVQLKYTYQRLVKKAGANTAEENANLYADAQKYCEKKIPTGFSGRYRLKCIQQYISDRDSQAADIPDSLYKFDFASPRWSPDLAGWSIVLAVVSLAAACMLALYRKYMGK